MRRARAETKEGIVEGAYDGEAGTIESDERTYRLGPDAAADLLPPCDLGAVYTIGYNYPDYTEMHLEADEPPEPFGFSLKAPVSVRASGEPVPYPAFSEELAYGGELTAVIGEECKNVAERDVPGIVEGYTILNDLLAADQETVGTMKVFDGSAPIGPCVATDVDPTHLSMQTTVDGETRQDASTAEMTQSPAEIVAELSRRCTLRPGDVVALGSPANPGTVEPGDEIAVTYEGIGTLRNTIVEPSG